MVYESLNLLEGCLGTCSEHKKGNKKLVFEAKTGQSSCRKQSYKSKKKLKGLQRGSFEVVWVSGQN
jgi:hypothetical protein